MDVFGRYAPFIQDFIYENGWQSLRAVQVAAADAIFNTDDNVLLSASTASGKTEAAFFPMLTMLDEEPSATVGIVYVGPLKALINDQFGRLTQLCEQADIPVWRWHGDVAQSRKNKLMRHPGGILQITPESLESMLLHRHTHIPALFGDLRFVVIDEIHSLMRADRGGQTICLIQRLARMAGCNPRRIGLSATIGDLEQAGEFLAAGSGRGAIIPRIDDAGQRWRLSMEHFYTSDRQATDDIRDGRATRENITQDLACTRQAGGAYPDGEPVDMATTVEIATGAPAADDGNLAGEASGSGGRVVPGGVSAELPGDTAPLAADPGIGYVFEHTAGRKCLVFANSREEAEAVTTTLRRYCEATGQPDRFLIHHGNLSASFRESAEELMRDEELALTTVTTATLELGIDIGRLERAFQIDAPFTVSSFLQRMGRTGRRGQPPEMWFVMREDRPTPRETLGRMIPWKLLQGIALVQLYLEERWVEPPRTDRMPFSLLYHQTLATLASGGEMSPAELAARVLTLAPFHRIGTDDFKVLLAHLVETEHIQLTETGGLIVGLAGERIVNNFRFYGVFQESEEYTVRSESQELGSICLPPPPGEKIAIAGATWIVEEVDHKRHLVYCTQVRGQVPAYFGECPGDINTHVLERMRGILAEAQVYPYLMGNARARLSQARASAVKSGMLEHPLINLGEDSWCLFPWLGSYAFLALERFLKIRCKAALGLKGVDSSRPYFIQFRMRADEQRFWSVLAEQASVPVDPMSLVYPDEVPVFEKYDEFVPAELIRKGFAHGILDVEGMLARVRQLCRRMLPEPQE